MKKTFTVITLIAVILIIFAAYFGIYGIEIPEEYAIVREGFKNTLTITLISAGVAHIAAILPGILLGKAGRKATGVISGIIGSLWVVAPFLVSALLIALSGNDFYMVTAAVTIPMFGISVCAVADITVQTRERNFKVHKLTLSGGKYFKVYTVPYVLMPYFEAAMRVLRTAFYTVILLEALNISGSANLGGLIGNENTAVSGTALAVAGIFVLLIQLLCILTKQKEETR